MSVELDLLRRQVRETQTEFAADVDRIVAELQRAAAVFSAALGEISYDDALHEVRVVTVKAFDRCADRRRG